MNRSIFMCVLMLVAAAPVSHASKLSFGAGFGALYSGLGINAAINNREGLLPYASAGCMGAKTSDDDTRYNCGLGVGIINAKWLSPNRLNHGIGFVVGITENDVDFEDEPAVTDTYLGVGYTWFSKSINRPGFTLGATPMVTTNKREDSFHLQVNLGYQF